MDPECSFPSTQIQPARKYSLHPHTILPRDKFIFLLPSIPRSPERLLRVNICLHAWLYFSCFPCVLHFLSVHPTTFCRRHSMPRMVPAVQILTV